MAVLSIVSVTLLGALIYLLCRKVPADLGLHFLVGWLSKLVGGILLGLVYSHYYAGDTFTFFNDAAKLARYFTSDPTGYVEFLFTYDSSHQQLGSITLLPPRSLFFVKIISPVVWLCGGNYWISSLWLSSFGFLGAWFIVRRLLEYWPEYKWPALISFLYAPSILFWGSGLIKESVATASLFYLFGLAIKGIHKSRPTALEIITGMAAMYLLFSLKYYFGAVFLLVSLPTLLCYALVGRTAVHPMIIWIICFVVLTGLVPFLHPNFYPQNLLQVIVENNAAFVNLSSPGGYVHFDNLRASWWSIVRNFPMALVSGFFRPFVWEARNFFSLLSAVENLVVLLAAGGGVWAVRGVPSRYRVAVLATLAYCFILSVFLSLSAPNFGTLVRYKVGFLPFLLYLSLMGVSAVRASWKIR